MSIQRLSIQRRPTRVPRPGPRLRLGPYSWHIIAVGIIAAGILLLAAGGLVDLLEGPRPAVAALGYAGMCLAWAGILSGD